MPAFPPLRAATAAVAYSEAPVAPAASMSSAPELNSTTGSDSVLRASAGKRVDEALVVEAAESARDILASRDASGTEASALKQVRPKPIQRVEPQGDSFDTSDLPQELICPITMNVMCDPVFTCDGQTYERRAVEEWLKQHDTSPLTGAVLDSVTLTPNVTLRSYIGRLLAERKVAAAIATDAVGEMAELRKAPFAELDFHAGEAGAAKGHSRSASATAVAPADGDFATAATDER